VADLMTINTGVADANTAGDIYPTHGWWNPWPTQIWPTYWYPSITYQVQPQPRCAWCQGEHIGKCERLKSVTYRRDGTVERVEFFEED